MTEKTSNDMTFRRLLEDPLFYEDEDPVNDRGTVWEDIRTMRLSDLEDVAPDPFRPATYREIAEELGISHEGVRQIEKRALRKVYAALKKEEEEQEAS